MKNFLPGKKTIIAAALTIAGFWGAYFSGDVTMAAAWSSTSTALMAIFLRVGIAKETENV